MKKQHTITAILDANVLYPAPLRDILLHLANLKCYQPKWTAVIHGEWLRNLLEKRPDLDKKRLGRTQLAMNQAFPDANIEGFEMLLKDISLPDENDVHVLAAAIKAKADKIVTFNLKDFPDYILKDYNLYAQHPDDFICSLLDHDEANVIQAFKNQVTSLKSPPQTEQQVIATLAQQGLVKSTDRLRDFLCA